MARKYRDITNIFYNPADPQKGKDASFSGDWPLGGKICLVKRTNKDGSPIPEGHPTWRLVWVDEYADSDGGQPQSVSAADHDVDPFS